MANRLDLHEEFCEILKTKNVYFNPPESVKMNYPAIRYKLAGIDITNANNDNYLIAKKYEVTIIDSNPDSDIYDEIIRRFPMCRFDRMYIASNLYHYVFTIYY